MTAICLDGFLGFAHAYHAIDRLGVVLGSGLGIALAGVGRAPDIAHNHVDASMPLVGFAPEYQSPVFYVALDECAVLLPGALQPLQSGVLQKGWMPNMFVVELQYQARLDGLMEGFFCNA